VLLNLLYDMTKVLLNLLYNLALVFLKLQHAYHTTISLLNLLKLSVPQSYALPNLLYHLNICAVVIYATHFGGPPPPGGVFFVGCFQMKSLGEEDPPWKTNPTIDQFRGLFSVGVPLPPGSWFGNHPKRKPPWGGGYPAIKCASSYDDLSCSLLRYSICDDVVMYAIQFAMMLSCMLFNLRWCCHVCYSICDDVVMYVIQFAMMLSSSMLSNMQYHRISICVKVIYATLWLNLVSHMTRKHFLCVFCVCACVCDYVGVAHMFGYATLWLNLVSLLYDSISHMTRKRLV